MSLLHVLRVGVVADQLDDVPDAGLEFADELGVFPLFAHQDAALVLLVCELAGEFGDAGSLGEEKIVSIKIM